MIPTALRTLLACWLALIGFAALCGPEGAGAQPPDGGEGEQPRLRVEGLVSGPEGPAAGVRVLLELSDMRIRRQVAFLETVSDDTGRFRFDLSEHDMPVFGLQFNTVSPRFQESLEIIEASRAEMPVRVELAVQPGAVAQGIVTDSEGTPLEGVEITSWAGVRPQVSDEKGEWEVFGLAMGRNQLTFRKEGFADEFLNVAPEGPVTVSGLEVVMQSARSLRGRVVDQSGEGVPRATALLRFPGRFQQTAGDESGLFVFKAVPKDVTGGELHLEAKGFLPTTHEISEADVSTEGEAESEEARTYAIDNGVFVRGHVRLPDGKPAPGSIVIAGEQGGPLAPRSMVRQDGQWELGPFPPGEEVAFTALPPNPVEIRTAADVYLEDAPGRGRYVGGVDYWPAGFASDFTATLANGKVEMRRRDKGERGFGAEVVYRADWDGAGNEIKGEVEVVGMRQSGTFSMRRRYGGAGGPLAGEWEIREFIDPSRLNVAPVRKSLALPIITGTTALDLALVPSRTLSGQVVKENERPFLDGEVLILDWNGSRVFQPRAEIGIAGRFSFDRVPDGVFRLIARSGDGQDSVGPVLARGGAEGLVLSPEMSREDPMDD
ncbi:MAG: carboxypeptidase-like regulatory domain-containing protein [Sumerlaeia bacterium]